MANLAKYIVQLEAQTAKYQRDLDTANRRLNRFHKNQKKGLKSIKAGWGALAGAVAAVGFAHIARQSIDTADKMVKLTERLGGTTEAYSELGFVAERSGVKFETLTMGLQRMTRRVAEASVGAGEAKGALKELRLDAEQLAKLPIDKQFEIIADRLAGVASQGDRTRLAMKLFDSEGVALLQTMKGGAAGIKALRDEARELGVTLDRDTAQKAVDAKDALANMDARLTSLARNMTLAFAPAISDAAEGIERFVVGLRAAFGLEQSFAFAEEIDELEGDIEKLDKRIARLRKNKDFFAGTFAANDSDAELKALLSTLDLYETKLASLKRQQLEALTPAPPKPAPGGGTDPAGLTTVANNADAAAKKMEELKDAAQRVFENTRTAAEEFNIAVAELLANPYIKPEEQGREIARLTEVLHSEIAKLPNPFEELEAEAAAMIERTRTPVERFNAEIQKVLAQPFVDAETKEREIARLTQILHDGLETMKDDTEAATDEMGRFADQAAANMQDAFADFLFDPFDEGLKGMLRSFIDTLRRMVANQLALQFFGLIGGIVSIPGRAAGGPVAAGSPYIVGERGPELYIPQRSGSILPSGAMGGHSFVFNTTIEGGGGSAQELLPLLEQRDRKLKGEFLDELNRGRYG